MPSIKREAFWIEFSSVTLYVKAIVLEEVSLLLFAGAIKLKKVNKFY